MLNCWNDLYQVVHPQSLAIDVAWKYHYIHSSGPLIHPSKLSQYLIKYHFKKFYEKKVNKIKKKLRHSNRSLLTIIYKSSTQWQFVEWKHNTMLFRSRESHHTLHYEVRSNNNAYAAHSTQKPFLSHLGFLYFPLLSHISLMGFLYLNMLSAFLVAT